MRCTFPHSNAMRLIQIDTDPLKTFDELKYAKHKKYGLFGFDGVVNSNLRQF